MSDLLTHLNQAQVDAVQHTGGPAMVLAGAGSGKTTVLTTRVAWLINQKQVQPQNLLVVTFTNKAATEIKNRIASITQKNLPFSGTFHSLSAKILRQHGYAIGLDPSFSIYDSDDQKKLLKQIYEDHNLDANRYSLEGVRATISNAKNEIITPQEYQEFAHGNYQEQVARIYEIYQRELKKAQAVDFDDLLLKNLELLRLNSELRNHYQQMFEHVLVDEYQDTNKVQYELTKLLSMPHNNLYVVGDFSQSIYAWRGADYRNMLLLKQDFANISEYRLEQNYRSDQTILDAATEVISHNTKHPILKLWTTQAQGAKISIIETSDNREEAETVVSIVHKQKLSVPYEEMAILYRTNAQSRAFEEALIKAGIPYALIGGTKFYERKEIKDLLAYLRYFVNSADRVSLERIENLGKRRLAQFVTWINDPKNKANQLAPPELLRKIIDITYYEEKYKLKTEENLSRLENIKELINVATQFETVTKLLENIALVQDSYFVDGKKENKTQNGIRLMSFHAVKGLEFTIVFMVGMEEGLLPHSRSLIDPDQMEEERRLCYVGITRAKKKLYCTYARSRFQYGTNNYSIRSRFLQDIPEELVDFDSTADNQKTFGDSKRRLVPIDESLAEAVLAGDFDIDAFIDS